MSALVEFCKKPGGFSSFTRSVTEGCHVGCAYRLNGRDTKKESENKERLHRAQLQTYTAQSSVVMFQKKMQRLICARIVIQSTGNPRSHVIESAICRGGGGGGGYSLSYYSYRGLFWDSRTLKRGTIFKPFSRSKGVYRRYNISNAR